MRRGLLDIVTLALLLVAVVAAGLWVRSLFWMDLVRVHRMDWDVNHNDIPQAETYVTSARGRVAWSGRRDAPPADRYLQRDFELHWQAGSLPPEGYFAGEGFWLGWVTLVGVALPAGRVGVWIWRRTRRPKRDGGETPQRARGAILVRVLAVLAWAATAAAILVATLWLRSYPYFERVDWKLWCSQSAGVQLNSSMGSLMLAWTNKGPDRMIKRRDFAFIRTCEPPTRGPLYQAAGLVGPYVQVAGFTLGSDESTTWPYNVLIAPDWFLEAVLLALGLLAWRAVRRQSKRASEHLCARCGYDLRATPDRCPECGLEPFHAPSSS